MNYKNIHDRLIEYCKQTPPRFRLEQRNLRDLRLKNTHIYVEVHHIIPRSLGGTDMINNLVTLLPEEHIFIHMLRWKIYKNRTDILAVRFCLNGYNKNKTCKPVYNLNKSIRMGYAWLRNQAAAVRSSTGWQTQEGRARISEARKGKIVVKDAITGAMIGSVENTHLKIKNGEWVHHSKGRKASLKERIKLKERSKGIKNSNSCGLNDSYFIEKGVELAREFKRIINWREMYDLSKERAFTWMVACACRFNRTGQLGFIKAVEEATGLKYDPYFSRRSKNK